MIPLMKTVLITGTNRGLGLEFSKQYLEGGYKVLATCRNPREAIDLQTLKIDFTDRLEIHTLDVKDHQSIENLSVLLRNDPIDILINNAGIIGPFPIFEHINKQRFGTFNYDVWEEVIRTNLFGPMKMTEAFMKQIEAGQEKKIIFLSSTVGSIQEGDEPAYAYASSKTALNKSISLTAEILKDKNIFLLALCPGYVKTRMNAGGANLDPEESIKGMIQQIESLDANKSGEFIRYNGEKIQW